MQPDLSISPLRPSLPPRSRITLSPLVSILTEVQPVVLCIRTPKDYGSMVSDRLLELRERSQLTNIQLADVVRGTIPSELLDVTEGNLRKLSPSRSVSNGAPAPTPAETKQIKALLRYLAHHRQQPILAASPLALLVEVPEFGEFRGEPAEAVKLRSLRTEFERITATTPPVEYQTRWPKQLARATREMARIQQAFDLHIQGAPISEIASTTGAIPLTVKSWLTGAVPWEIDQLRRWLNPKRKARILRPPLTESTALATVVGAYQGTSWHRGMTKHLRFVAADRAALEPIGKALEELHPSLKARITPCTIRGRPRYRLSVNQGRLATELRSLTGENNRFPFELLGTDSERRAYLRSFFSFSGSIRHSSFRVESSNHRELIIGIALTLSELMVPVEVSDGIRASLSVSSDYGIARLNHLDLLPPVIALALTERIKRGEKQEDPRLRFNRVMSFCAENPTATLTTVAKAVGEPTMTVRAWMRGDANPRLVSAERSLEEWRDLMKLPFPGTVPYLTRELKIPVKDALRLGHAFRLEQLKGAVQRISSSALSALSVQQLERQLKAQPEIGGFARTS